MNETNQNTPELLLHFGSFTLNLQRRGLYKGEERVRLTAKPLETLIFLVENRGRVVQKQEILNAVWKGTFVTEDTLVHAIREIRRALADERDNPRFILTVPREGYRFVCEVLTPTESEAKPISSTPSLVDVSLAPINSPSPVPTLAGNVERRRFRRLVVLLVTGLLVVLTLALGVATKNPSLQRIANLLGLGRPASPKTLRTTEHKLLTATAFSEGKPALSSNGKLLLYVSTSPDDNEKTDDGKIKTFGDLFVREISNYSPTQITHQENPSGDIPVFTADGNFVVFSNYPSTDTGSSLPDLYKVGSNGGWFDENNQPSTKKPFIKEASGAGFSPDRQWVAYTKHLTARKALWRSPANDPNSDHKEIADNGFTPRWSGDGKLLAYTTSNPNGGLGDIWVMDAATLTSPRNLTNEPQQIYGLTWTPDNRFLIFASKRTGPSLLWQIPIEGGPPQSLTGLAGDFSAPSMSRDGNTLVFSYYRGAQNLLLVDGLKAEKRNLTTDDYHEFVRLSPSGEFVATVMQQPYFGEHLYVTDLRGNPTRLTDHASHHPSWSGEKKVCYLKWDQSSQRTHVIEVDITNLNKPVPKHITTFKGRADWLDVNPADVTKLAVVLTVDGRQQIVLRDLTKNKDMDTVIASELEYATLRWSRDGSTLAWSGPAEAGNLSGGIWMIKPGEKAARRPVTEGYGPVWSADSSVIYFGRIGARSGLWEINLSTSKETLRHDWNQTPFFDLVGNRLVYCELGSSSTAKNRVYSLSLEAH